MSKEYVEQRDGSYYVIGRRISLDSIVYAFRRGAAPESILRSFPLLSLEEIYGAIAYYLSHQVEIDDYLALSEQEYERQRQTERADDPEFYKRIEAAKASLHQEERTTRNNP
jgi:uncharacterized protein (DUF433 family)